MVVTGKNFDPFLCLLFTLRSTKNIRARLRLNFVMYTNEMRLVLVCLQCLYVTR